MNNLQDKILRKPVVERSVWMPKDLTEDQTWIHQITDQEQHELHDATLKARERQLVPCEFEKSDFTLPTLGPRVEKLVDEVENGRGVALLKGIPVARYSDDELRTLFWGLGLHTGTVISQNSRGQRLAEVVDRGNSYSDPNARGFATNAELAPHVDTSDMTVLLCVKTAVSGGQSRVLSSTKVYNVILQEHPEYLEPLYRGFYNDLRGEGPSGDINELTRFRIPVYSNHAGRVSCSFNSRMIDGALTKRNEVLDPLQQKAYEFMCSVTRREELAYWFTMAPGDVQMISNHSVFHSRTEYQDHDDPAQKRRLLRLWVNIPDGRELAENFADRYNTGPRGGVAMGDGARYTF